MFTGIIETLGKVVKVDQDGGNTHLTIRSIISAELSVDQSVSHNGICLTVTEVNNDVHKVTAIQETLSKTNLQHLKSGDMINLERCTPVNSRFDGHIVQGHVDQTAKCTAITEQDGSWQFDFEYGLSDHVTVEKGSICINGISLTCFNSANNGFSVAIIPYTYEHTTMNQLKVDDFVNLEFDIIGKYVSKILNKP